MKIPIRKQDIRTLADLKRLVDHCEKLTEGVDPDQVQVKNVGCTPRRGFRLSQLDLEFDPPGPDDWARHVTWADD